MSYTLRASISTGRIDIDGETFVIRDGRVAVEDYDAAAMLVADFGMSWPDGDPGAPDTQVTLADASGDGGDGDDAADADDDADDAADADDDAGGEGGTDEGIAGTCGYFDPDSMAEPCKRDAGWGRDTTTGRCKDHHTTADDPAG